MKKWPVCSVACFATLWTSARATVYDLPTDGSAVFGTDIHIKSTYHDTLLDIAHRYSIGYEEIIRANPGVDMWLPGEGTDVLLPGRRILPPGPREGIVVNLPEHRLYYYPKHKKGHKPVVITYPVSIGRMDWHSPLGETQVVGKEKHPNWYPPESIRKEHAREGDPLPRVVHPGPKNPLGDYKMRLAVGDGTYEIHGTNNPLAVGMAITHGCIRMYPEDVAALFAAVPVGTKVWLINDPVKVTFVDGDLLLEAHPPVDSEGQTVEPNLELLSQQLDRALGNTTAAIHWDFARAALQAATGMPTLVGLQADMDPRSAAASAVHAAAASPQPAGPPPVTASPQPAAPTPVAASPQPAVPAPVTASAQPAAPTPAATSPQPAAPAPVPASPQPAVPALVTASAQPAATAPAATRPQPAAPALATADSPPTSSRGIAGPPDISPAPSVAGPTGH